MFQLIHLPVIICDIIICVSVSVCVVCEHQLADGEEHQYSCDVSHLLEFKMTFLPLKVMFKSLRLS